MTPREVANTERIADLYVRGLTGAPLSEKTYYSRALPTKIRELVAKHGIRRAPDDVMPRSVALVGHVFAAAVELLTELGVYCNDTKRLIPLTHDDIEAGLRRAPAWSCDLSDLAWPDSYDVIFSFRTSYGVSPPRPPWGRWTL